mmetsp:Transcript_39720/g.79392  ORF Transcript_39720/g.79392 Transcript_39720/m.79392 type:complete len:205 (-) Transcript_39720:1751-2365(-)
MHSPEPTRSTHAARSTHTHAALRAPAAQCMHARKLPAPTRQACVRVFLSPQIKTCPDDSAPPRAALQLASTHSYPHAAIRHAAPRNPARHGKASAACELRGHTPCICIYTSAPGWPDAQARAALLTRVIGRDLPDEDATLRADGDDRPLIWRDAHRIDRTRVAFALIVLGALVVVPHVDTLVGAARDEKSAVRVDVQAVDIGAL